MRYNSALLVFSHFHTNRYLPQKLYIGTWVTTDVNEFFSFKSEQNGSTKSEVEPISIGNVDGFHNTIQM